ncbi:MAG: PilW family protein [Gammaproteobacteria bacterium]|nr:PilW family protein [Gammaproteobacteria bacterium]
MISADTKKPSNHRFRLLHMQPRRTSFGYTIVELMVALTIGLIILAAVSKIFSSSHSTYTLEEGLARTQEAGRFAMEFLSRDLRMAGYMGCSSSLTLSTPVSQTCPSGTICNLVNPPSQYSSFNTAGITSYRYTGAGTSASDWSPNLPSDLFPTVDVKAGTDVIMVQYASQGGANLTGNNVPDNANVKIKGTATLAPDIKAGDILIVTDCKNGDVFKTHQDGCGGTCASVITVAHTTGNSQNKLSHRYGNNAELMKLVTHVYYIKTNPINSQPTLYRKELIAGALQSLELVEGIEEMRFTFGVDTDATADNVPNVYLTASNASVGAWDKVVSARLGLVARTLSPADADIDTKTYTLDGTVIDPPNDRYRRQYFSSTIQLRN